MSLFVIDGKILIGGGGIVNCPKCPCYCQCISDSVCGFCGGYTPSEYVVSFSGVTDIPNNSYCLIQDSDCLWVYECDDILIEFEMTAAGEGELRAYYSAVQKFEAALLIDICCPLGGTGPAPCDCPCTWPDFPFEEGDWPCGELEQDYVISFTYRVRKYSDSGCTDLICDETVEATTDVTAESSSCHWFGTGFTMACEQNVGGTLLSLSSCKWTIGMAIGFSAEKLVGDTPVGNYGDAAPITCMESLGGGTWLTLEATNIRVTVP